MAGPIPDLTLLHDVTGPTILNHLQSNYAQDAIYTYIGDILLALNPFRSLPIYGPKVGIQYCTIRELQDCPPHIYAVAHRVHKHLSSHHEGQCVLFLGESGSGKTENCKMLISQLVRESDKISEPTGNNIGFKLTETMNILDAFGNASTQLNDNASRFTKRVDILHDKDGVIVGANISAYHLENTRVTCPWEEEQNFNIFYHLLAGLSPTELRYYYLDGDYRIISPIPDKPLYQSSDIFEFHKERLAYVKDTINNELGIQFGLSRQQNGDGLYAVFGLLAALLHLGNVQFYTDQSGGALVANDEEIGMAASLMNVLPQELTSVLLSSSTYLRGQMITKRNSDMEASHQRNMMLQTIYNKLFHWLIYHINMVLSPGSLNRSDLQCITIVDPPGFEARTQNGLEQLHYNILTEKLHQFAYNSIFLAEYQYCEREGVKVSAKLSWNDNRNVVETLDMSGLLGILEETSRLKVSTDVMFLEKLNKNLGKKKQFVKNKIGTYFTIVHTSETINYGVCNIISKNINRVPDSIIGLMLTSQNPLVTQLFSKQRPQTTETMTQQFQSETNEILHEMTGKKLHLIRCIKPNPAAEPKFFDQRSTMKQLEVASVIELIKIRQKGFSVRILQDEFVQRYKFLAFPITSNPRSLTGACHRIIKSCKFPESGVVVSNKMVFMQYWHLDRLDSLFSNELRKVVITQSCVRRHMARKQYIYKLQRLRGDRAYVQEFSSFAEKQGNSACYLLREQADHNHTRFQQQLQQSYGNLGSLGGDRYGGGSRYGRQDSDWGSQHYRKQGELYNTVIASDVTGDAAFFQHQLDRVVKRRDSLEAGSWCKIIYMERDKEVAKFFLSEKEVTIDGSYDEYDENKIGLGVFRNPQRDEESSKIRSWIREGVTIKRGTDGSIWAFRHCDEQIIVNGHRNPSNHCISADVIMNKGRLPLRSQIKIFESKELKANIGLELKSSMFNMERLMHQCVSCLSFSTEGRDALESPVWLCIINLMALEMLESQEVLKEVQGHLTQLKLESSVMKEIRNEEHKQHQEVKQLHGRQAWSKSDARDQNSTSEVSPAKLRMELRKQGQSVKEHMNYSWDEPLNNKQNRTVGELQQEFLDDPTPDYDDYYLPFNRQTSNTSTQGMQRKDWAKIKVNLKKDSAKQETNANERHPQAMF